MFNNHKVYIFISRFPPPFGGVSNQVKWIAENACSKDSSLTVFVIDIKALVIHQFNDGLWNSNHLYKSMFFYWCLMISLLPSFINSIRDQSFSLRLDRFLIWRFLLYVMSHTLSRYFKNKDVQLIYSFHLGAPSLLGGWLAKSFESKHLTAVFGEAFTNYQKLSSQKNLLLELSGEIVSCSDHCGRILRSLDKDIKYSVLYYGSDLQKLSELYTKKPAMNGCKDMPKIMFLGRLNAEMGIIYFLDLIEALNTISLGKFRYLICGQEDAELERVREFKKSFSGLLDLEISVPFAKRDELLIDADVLVVPSTNERACFGLAITEGIAAGCLVYARDVGGHAEPMLGERRFLFDKNLHPENLANIIINDLCDNTINATLIELRKRVVERFDIAACMNAQLNFIDAIKKNG